MPRGAEGCRGVQRGAGGAEGVQGRALAASAMRAFTAPLPARWLAPPGAMPTHLVGVRVRVRVGVRVGVRVRVRVRFRVRADNKLRFEGKGWASG